MADLKVRKISLARLIHELNSGRPVLLVPLFAKLQPATEGFVMLPVDGVQPQVRADQLQLDVCGDSGLILAEVKRTNG